MKTERQIGYLLLIFSLVSSGVKSQPSTFYTGKTDTLYSEILKEKRPLFIYLPDDYESSETRYPVIFILDGESRCAHAVPTIAFMVENKLMPPSIIVGIPNIDRNRDFLPGNGENLNVKDSSSNFLNFLTSELFIFLEKRYKTGEYRILIGHSFGGVFSLYALINQPDAFDGYIMIDPAFSFLSNNLNSSIARFFKDRPDFPKSVYISGRSGPGMTEMGIQNVDSIMKTFAPKNFRLKTQEYTGENHTSIAFKTIYDGLQFTYEGYIVPKMFVFPGNGVFIVGKPFAATITTKEPCDIRYTLDGTTPTESSLLISAVPDTITSYYSLPDISINNPCTLKLWVPSRFSTSEVVTCVYVKGLPMNPQKIAGKLRNGIRFKYYEGYWDRLPDLSKLKPAETGIMESIRFNDSFKKDSFAVQYEALVNIKEDGYYDIGLFSDDGSRLYFNNRLMVDNDGLHDASDLPNYRLYLNKGYYPIRIDYFEQAGDEVLNFILIKYPWTRNSNIFCPKELLFYKE